MARPPTRFDPRISSPVVCGVSIGCGSSSTTVLSPSPLAGRCGVRPRRGLLPRSAPRGGTGTVHIQTNRECSWNVPQLPTWVKLSQPVTPQGSAEIAFIVEENRSTSLRSWEVVVNDQRALISQEAAICTWSLSPAKDLSWRDGRRRAGGPDNGGVLLCGNCRHAASWIAITPDRGQGTTEITRSCVSQQRRRALPEKVSRCRAPPLR